MYEKSFKVKICAMIDVGRIERMRGYL